MQNKHRTQPSRYEFKELTTTLSIRDGKIIVNKVLEGIPDDAIAALIRAEYGQVSFYTADISYNTMKMLRENFLSKKGYSKKLSDVSVRLKADVCARRMEFMDEVIHTYRGHVKSKRRSVEPHEMPYLHIAYAPFDAFENIAVVYRAGALVVFNEKIVWDKMEKKSALDLIMDIWDCIYKNTHVTFGTTCEISTFIELPYHLSREILIL